MPDPGLLTELDQKIAAAEGELKRLREALATALQRGETDAIERTAVLVESCERQIDQLYVNRVALVRTNRRRQR